MRSPVVKLHGDLARHDTVVLSRLDYRRRLYSDLAYLGFLRSVFLFNTVLYMGFSFTDAYINQLRSETLEMLGRKPRDRPRSYAILNDVPDITKKHLNEIEGIEAISFDTNGGADFGAFDSILEAIHDETSPLAHFGRLLSGRRILWVDPNPHSVAPITRQVLPLAAETARCTPCSIEPVGDVKAATETLARNDYDLVVSHWGHDTPGGPAALQLLEEIRARRLHVPLIVFASASFADENKKSLLMHGGVGYYHSWDGLLRGFEHVFSSGASGG
jgi:CheY-like chemotaxis protein